MAEIQEVATDIYRLEIAVPGISSVFSAYAIRDRKSALVEPGPGACIPDITEGLRRLGIKSLSYIIPTHVHLDHAGAAGKLAELFPLAQVIAHPRGARHLIDPSRWIGGSREAFGADFEERYGAILPIPEARTSIPGDGDTLDIGDRELTVLHTPGHTPNHISLWEQRTSALFAGEALGVPLPEAPDFPLPATAPPGFDLEEYLDTMKRLQGLNSRTVFYSHDGMSAKPDGPIQQAIDNTRAIGDIIWESLKANEATEQIARKIEEYLFNALGSAVEPGEMERLISGYLFYFNKKYGATIPEKQK